MKHERIPLDEYLVFDPTDKLGSSLCIGREEAIKVVSYFGPGCRVRRITEGELCRDVTADFLPDDEPEFIPEYERAASAADRKIRMIKEGV
jgi:hypothetical protein